MKNLKKVLALVLVVATLMTMTTIASAKFTDDDSINYNEAVDVLTAINVINGYTDGSFRPEGNVTRAQMAKMVSYIVAGGEDVGNLYAGANSFSDCTTHWAKGYIAYANKTGIVAGVGNGKFNPDGSVTGTQAAKMMLCALGYDSDAEGYTGTSWSVNVLSDAKSAGLLKGLEKVDMSAAMTREQAAQLMLNALKADMVEYDRGNINISSGDTNITIGGSSAKKVENKDTDYTTSNGESTATSDGVKQLCEEYFPSLLLNDDDKDAFGRTAITWTYEKKEVGTYAATADLTYTGTVKASDIYKDLGKVEVATVKTSSNGAALSTSSKTISANSTDTFGDLSRTVEVFYDKDTKTASLFAIDYILGEVTKVNAAKYDKDGDVTTEANIEITYGSGSKVTYETTAFEKGDMVLFTQNNNYATTTERGVQSVQKAETVEGKVTAVKGNDVTINGTTYTAKAGVVELGSDGTYYLGIDGSIIGFDGVVSSDDYLYIYKVVKGDPTVNDDGIAVAATYTAYTVDAAGTKASYTLDSDLVGDGEGCLFEDSDVSTYTGVICYKINSDGELTTAPAATTGVTTMASVKFGKTTAVVNGKYSNAESTFVFTSQDGNKMDVKVVTGYKNVAEQTANAAIVYNTETDEIVTVFVAAAPVAATSENDEVYILLDSDATITKDSDDEDVYAYAVQLNGEATTLTAKSDVFDGKSAGYMFTVTLTDGIIDKAGDISPVATKTGTVSKIVDDYIVVTGNDAGTYTIDADAEFYLSEADGNTVTLTGTTLAVDDVVTFYLVGGTGDNATYVAGGLVTRS